MWDDFVPSAGRHLPSESGTIHSLAMKLIRPFNQHERATVWLELFTSLVMLSSGAQAAPGGLGTGPASGTATGVNPGRANFAGGSSMGGGRSGGTPTGLGNRSFSPGITGNGTPVQNTGTAGPYQNNVVPQNVARVNNLWTQQPGAGIRQRISPQPGTAATQYHHLNSADQQTGSNGQADLGTHLYPGSYGSNLAAYNGARNIPNNSNQNGHYHGDHSRGYRGRYFYFPYYGYGYNYYPYAGGYYGGDASFYPGYATSAGLNAEASLTPDLNPYDGGSQPSSRNEGGGNPSAVIPPGAAQVDAPYGGSQAPWADQQQAPRPAASRGPDSLVEAVQSELSSRGYFKGKVDAMFGDDTKAAIGRFQKDNQLAVTGLVNNATLTMLGLN